MEEGTLPPAKRAKVMPLRFQDGAEKESDPVASRTPSESEVSDEGAETVQLAAALLQEDAEDALHAEADPPQSVPPAADVVLPDQQNQPVVDAPAPHPCPIRRGDDDAVHAVQDWMECCMSCDNNTENEFGTGCCGMGPNACVAYQPGIGALIAEAEGEADEPRGPNNCRFAAYRALAFAFLDDTNAIEAPPRLNTRPWERGRRRMFLSNCILSRVRAVYPLAPGAVYAGHQPIDD
eukprot:gb/GEZN01013187.1/.p1 GENE.gb/GEZN01013187.1/~~gb/GEZN01013187.1/.p1  ORF type:complete len:236 (+),score=25.14 gb/GEZN01013187.1/:36-743(+)